MEEKNVNFVFIIVFVLALGITCFACYKVFSATSGNNSKTKSVNNITKELKKYCNNVNAAGSYDGKNGKCTNFECYYNDDGDVYTYDCKDGNGKAEKQSSSDLKLNSNIALATGCASMDINGNYSSDHLQCKNFVCTLEYYGNKYTKDCMGK